MAPPKPLLAAAALLLAADGRLSRVLSPLALTGRDLRLALIEAGEGRDDPLVDRPLEWDDQVRKFGELRPAPSVEFRLVSAAAGPEHVDQVLAADEAVGEPFLRLAPVLALPRLADERSLVWNERSCRKITAITS